MSMRRFTRAEDLEGLERIGRPSSPPSLSRQEHQQERWKMDEDRQTLTSPPTALYPAFHNSSSSSSLPLQQPASLDGHTGHGDPSHFTSNTSRRGKRHHYHYPFESEHDNTNLVGDYTPSRQYIEEHTTFLDSTDLDSSGIIPDSPQYPLHHHHHRREGSLSVPGTPTSSFLSSPSIGFYSQRSSRPSSRAGFWLDDHEGMASSLNLVMPTSAMHFVKCREPTERGQNMGYVKLMVCGDSQENQERLLQLLLHDWTDIIASDIDDYSLQQQLRQWPVQQELPVSSSSSFEQRQSPLHPNAAIFKNTTIDAPSSSSVLVGESASPALHPLTPGGAPLVTVQPGRTSEGGNRGHREGGTGEIGVLSVSYDGEGGKPAIAGMGERYTALGQQGSGTQTETSRDVPTELPTEGNAPYVLSEGYQDQQRPPSSPLSTPPSYPIVTERFASTTVLPAWARVGYDEQETGHEILVKNVCFVQTPGGLRTSNNPQRLMDPVLAYLGLQFQATNEFFSRSAQSNDSLGRFLVSNSTGAHSHVDMCLYIIDGQLWPVDIQYMKRLSGLVNLVPVLVPAEGRAPGQVRLDRLELMHYLRDNKIDIYGMDIDEVDHGEGHEAINNDDNAAGDRGPACREAFQAPDPLTSVPLTPFLSPPFVLYLSPSRSSPASFASESVAATTNHSTQDNIDEKISQLNIPPAYPSSPGSMAVDHSLLDLWNSQQMHIVRDWMLITHLAALRYHTTRKFLEWRQQLPWMALSDSFYSQYQSSGNRSGPFGATGDVSYSSGKDSKSGTSSEGGYQPDVQVSPHANQHVYRLPSEHMAHVQARNQQRISESVTKILETDAIVLRRIIRERQEAWRQALELIEREERVEFLVQELKRWATEGSEQRYGHTEARHASSLPSDLRHPIDLGAFAGGDGQEVARNAPLHHRHRYHHHQHARSDLPFGGGRNNGLDLERSAGAAPLQQRTTEEIRRTSTLEATTQAGKQPSSSSFMQSWFTPAPRVSSSASSRTRSRTRRGASCLENENANKDTRPVLSLKAPLSLAATHPTRNRGSRNPVIVEPTRYVEEEDSDESESDPLRLGSIAGRLLGAMGRGILNVVVLLTMTGISQWVYSNFLEHRVEWIV